MVKFAATHKPKFARIQEFCLIFIVYTTFSKTFREGTEAGAKDIVVVFIITLVLLAFFMGLSWVALSLLFNSKISLRIMGFFGCHHKTVAMGLPLINAIYEDNPKLGMYALPLLLWHPTQLLVGTALAPKLKEWVDA